MHNLTAWIATYIDALPDQLRPSASDTRLQIAADQAAGNGWNPSQMASVVRSANIGNARNPALVAIMRLEEHGDRKPARVTRVSSEDWRDNLPQHCPHPGAQALDLQPNQCHLCRQAAGAPDHRARRQGTCEVCPPGYPCPSPVTSADDAIPAEWIAERRELLDMLMVTPDMTEDQRGDAMASLIGRQRAT